jgi:hypothetical protein
MLHKRLGDDLGLDLIRIVDALAGMAWSPGDRG